MELSQGRRAVEGAPETVDLEAPTSDFDRIKSLAVMARALGRSAELHLLLETAAEEALLALNAASVSVSRLEAGTGMIRTIINVGDLGPQEERWPQNEVYGLHEFSQLASRRGRPAAMDGVGGRPGLEPQGGRAAPRPGEGHGAGRPDDRRRRAVG